jgi:hypothetical protein
VSDIVTKLRENSRLVRAEREALASLVENALWLLKCPVDSHDECLALEALRDDGFRIKKLDEEDAT